MSLVSISSDSGEEYTVEKILAKRMVNGKAEYQIKWQNYPVSEATWEPLSNLKYVLSMVKEFEKNLDGVSDAKPKKPRVKSSSSSDSDQQRQRKIKKTTFRDEDNTSSSQEPQKKSRMENENEVLRQSAQKGTSADKEPQQVQKPAPESQKKLKEKDVQKDRDILRELENARPQTQQVQIQQKPQQPPKEEGCYEDNDSAKEILNLRKNNEKKTLEFQIAWKPRPNQKTPMPSWIADSMLKIHNPEVLCDYLLKKIKWPKPSNE